MSHYKPDPNKNVNLTIDGKAVTVPEGTRILEAARKVNVHIPTLCEHPDLCKRGVCRLCVVECDGRGKLLAACANDVWEGVNIVTHNLRILGIRKMILELLLANHPQDCLSCIRSTNCELQTLAADFGIRESCFRHDAADCVPPVIESETLVRDMSKCVKCGRCVEACQEVQTIRAINTSHRSKEYEISTPYGQALKESSCVFCGQCASVCPVGAIYEHDQCAEVRAALNDSGRKTIAQVPPSFASALEDVLSLAAGTITTGKINSAVKLLGFDKVYDMKTAATSASAEINSEVTARRKAAGKLPVVTGCAEGVGNFVKNFYPDLAAHLITEKTARRTFASVIKNGYAKEAGIESSAVTSVSLVPCLAQKYAAEKNKTDYALTAAEFARMINLAGI